LRCLGVFGVDLHERPAGVLAQRVERQQAPRRRQRGLLCPLRHRLRQLPARCRFVQLAQPLAFDKKPILERRIASADPLEQIAAVEPYRPLQPRWARRTRQPFKFRNVYAQGCGVELG
jgi:hypothetical protein